MTTQQALDFKDIEGDRLLGRKTIPIAAPSLARPSLVLLMCIWTTGLTIGWKLDAYVSAAFYFIGYLAACRFLFLGTVADDKRSCLFYHVRIGKYVFPSISISNGMICRYGCPQSMFFQHIGDSALLLFEIK